LIIGRYSGVSFNQGSKVKTAQEDSMKKKIIQNCPICENKSKLIDVVPTIHLSANDKVELRSCDSCGHWWHSPVPNQEELTAMYNLASSYVVSAGAKESYQNKNSTDSFYQYILRNLNKKPGIYLEIGAGGGGLLRRFREMNYTCFGVDPGQWVKDRSIVSSINDLPMDLQCDVIVLQDVIEHVLHPVELLTRLKTIAGDGCIFFCSFPCNDSRTARIFKSKWAMVRPYGHLHYFSLNSAQKMFSLVDLTVHDIRLARVIPISTMLRSWNVRRLLYEILIGSKDQIYAQVVFQKTGVWR
jgi:hypothetical protein